MDKNEILTAPGERQISKRNEVCIVDCGGILCVRKHYLQPGAAEIENKTLNALAEAHVDVPRILYFDGEYMVQEHIPGMTYEAVLSEYESDAMRGEELADAVSALADWLICWYAVTGKKRGDVNLRNFIWTGIRCVGIDFEEETGGPPFEEDMGRIIAYSASYDPVCTAEKKRFCALLLKKFEETGASPEMIEQYALAETDVMLERRKNFSGSAEKVRAFIRSLFSSQKKTEADR